MKHRAVAVCVGIALIGMSLAMQGKAWGVTPPTSAVITFNDAAQSVTLTIPTPACPTTQPDCRWKFFLNEPKLHVDVAIVYGTSGSLTIPYPPNFCGVIQADAYIGGPPWVPKRGWQHTIADCTAPVVPPPPPGPPTVVATSATTTTTTTVPSTPVDSPVVLPATGVTGDVSSVSDAPASPAAPIGEPKAAAAVTSTQLPFTGLDVKPLLYLGGSMVGLGLCLMLRARKGAHSLRR
jgi:hypothetical protein